MKALALRPTWAWFVVNGHKDIENRSWPTRLRGLIWIQASSGPVTKAEYEEFLEICRQRRIKTFPAREGLQRGGIVGSVEIVDCVAQSRSFWFRGEYGFVLRNARKTTFRPIKGRLGFFEVDETKLSKPVNDDTPEAEYIAYHSTQIMGYEFRAREGRFDFLSRKSRSFLQGSIGCNVWVVTGTHNSGGKTTYC